MYQYETYGFIHDMLDLWLRHSPLRDFKDKYGAIGPHIGVVTARDWSCGLIYHIIYILTCKILSLLYCCKMSSGIAFLKTNLVTATKQTVAPKICPLWDLGSIPYGKNRKVLGAYMFVGLSNVLLLRFSSNMWRENPMCYL